MYKKSFTSMRNITITDDDWIRWKNLTTLKLIQLTTFNRPRKTGALYTSQIY